jgi:hypothetical protein
MHQCLIRNVYPLSTDADTIPSIFALPIGIVDVVRVTAVAATPFSALQVLEPSVEFRMVFVMRTGTTEDSAR